MFMHWFSFFHRRFFLLRETVSPIRMSVLVQKIQYKQTLSFMRVFPPLSVRSLETDLILRACAQRQDCTQDYAFETSKTPLSLSLSLALSLSFSLSVMRLLISRRLAHSTVCLECRSNDRRGEQEGRRRKSRYGRLERNETRPIFAQSRSVSYWNNNTHPVGQQVSSTSAPTVQTAADNTEEEKRMGTSLQKSLERWKSLFKI